MLTVQDYVRRYFDTLAVQLADAPPGIREEFTFRETPQPPKPLQALESRLPVALPPTFRTYLTCGSFAALEADGYVLPGVPEDDPLALVEPFLLCDELWPLGYLQFGCGPCGDPLCFDIVQAPQSTDYPIVCINHDQAPHDAWQSREALQPACQTVAPSFLALLAKLCDPREI